MFLFAENVNGKNWLNNKKEMQCFQIFNRPTAKKTNSCLYDTIYFMMR